MRLQIIGFIGCAVGLLLASFSIDAPGLNTIMDGGLSALSCWFGKARRSASRQSGFGDTLSNPPHVVFPLER